MTAITGMYRRIFIAGIIAYLFMLVLSVVFYKERMICIDSAFYLFEILRKGDFSVQHYRFIAIMTEIFPLLAEKLSLPLDVVMMSYSVGIVVYQFIIYMVCGLVLKSYRMATVLLLFNMLFATYTFYWAISELPQAVALLVLWLAYKDSECRKNKALSVAFLAVIPMLAFAHPLMLFPLGYALLFFMSDKRMDRRTVILTIVVFFATLVIKALFFSAGYERGALGGLRNFQRLFPDYFNIHSNRVFLRNVLALYYWIPLCSVIITIFYISSRQWFKLAVFWVSIPGYLLLINVSYPGSGTEQHYIENLYLPVGLFLALPLSFDVLPALHKRRLAYILMAAVLATAFVRLYNGHRPFALRLNWERNFLETHGGQKIMVDEKYAPLDTLLNTWATPYEFWILSTLEKKKTASIIITNNLPDVEWAVNEKKSFVTKWGVYNYDLLDKRYFSFSDTVNHYTIIK